MTSEIPGYCLRAYALFYNKHGSREPFRQSELDWIVGESMRKKIFSILLRSGWIEKVTRDTYKCIAPDNILKGLMEFKVPGLMKESEKAYAFTALSAVEIWSDYSYVMRSIEKSPYFIKVLKKDLRYWKEFFNKRNVPNYVTTGRAIGEHVILIPADRLDYEELKGLKVEPLKKTMDFAGDNEMYSYAFEYMRHKYGSAAA
jgi:hypothetical protein